MATKKTLAHPLAARLISDPALSHLYLITDMGFDRVGRLLTCDGLSWSAWSIDGARIKHAPPARPAHSMFGYGHLPRSLDDARLIAWAGSISPDPAYADRLAILDAATLAPISPLPHNDPPPLGTARHIVRADKRCVHVLNPHTLSPQRELAHLLPANAYGPPAVACDGDTLLLSSGADHCALDLNTGDARRLATPPGARLLAISEAGRWVAIAAAEGPRLISFDDATERRISTDTTPHAAASSADGQRLFIASHDHTLRCVDVATGQQRWARRLPGHATLLAVHPALPIVAAAYQQRAALFDAATGEPLLLVGPGSPMGALSFPDADTIIAAPGPDLPRESWRAPLLAWRWPATGGAATTTSDAPPPQAQLALASGALIRSVARPIGKKTELALEHIRHDGATTTLATHPKKDPAVRMAVHEALGLLVAASEERELRVYDLATDALLHTLTGLKRAPEHVAISPDGARVVAVENKTIMSWPLGSGPVWSQTTKLSQRALTLTPDSAHVLTADSDAGKNIALPCELHRWDAQTGAPVDSRPLPWSRAVGALAFSPAGALLATGPDANLYAIDLTT